MVTPCSCSEPLSPKSNPHPPVPPSDRPFVLLNMAISADGKIAGADRRFGSFGSRLDQTNLYRLRSTVDAVLCGARTAGVPEVTLDAGAPRFVRARLRQGLSEQPLAVIVSGRGRLSSNAAVLDGSRPPPIILTTHRAPATAVRELRRRGAEVVAFGRQALDLTAALKWLRQVHGVRRLVCEGGGELNDAMFRAGLIDEVHLTLCPVLIGGRDAPTIADGIGTPRLGHASRLRPRKIQRRAAELFLVYDVLPRPRNATRSPAASPRGSP